MARPRHTRTVRPKIPILHRLLRRPDPLGLVGALVFWWASLSPSLLPRGALIQGAIGGLSLLLGYGLGVLIRALVDFGLSFTSATLLNNRIRRRTRAVLLAVSPLILLGGSLLWVRWQNDQRPLVGAPDLAVGAAFTSVAMSVAVFVVLLEVGRLIATGIVRLERFMERFMAPALARGILALALPLLALSFTSNAIIEPVFNNIDQRYASTDAGTAEGVTEPTSELVSGGPGSAVSWDSLGYNGRSFVADGPTASEIEALHPGDRAMEPIRVYAGLRSADGFDAQAQLVVDELERTGAFERKALVVVASTGTGWVDPIAAAGLEVLLAGDTATAAMQYSYLPSWISFLVDSEESAGSATTLFDAVRERWAALPENDRPRLVVFGESLGSLGSENTFAESDAEASIADAVTKADSIFWVGPTNSNPIWNQLIDDRDPETPSWDPTFGDGETVLFSQSGPDLIANPPASPPRVLYLQHPSDPVGWINVRSLWAPPLWMAEPRAPEVSARARWFPGVTLLQGLADLMAGFGAAPGYGHDYTPDVVGGLSILLQPDGWSSAQVTDLSQTLMDRYPDS